MIAHLLSDPPFLEWWEVVLGLVALVVGGAVVAWVLDPWLGGR